MMNAYFGSAVITKLYVQESNSAEAARLVSAGTAPYALTHWQEIEVRTALRLKLFRREITADELHASLSAFDEDIATGRWQRPDYSLAEIHDRAAQLSARHAAEIGCRTLDIFHVAAAFITGTPEFVSLDDRQRELAKREGLKVKP
ncbi:MAG TPA: type II toxin-antitoxin system VapC family toxin [Verrucomicrobiae bacterium]|nr:type II toxin-antitoxin system VapC family toxin [Verrucomicrobiae bacterium]